ncbi:polysaccharide biosynthesis C-terminal domain-containing protein [Limnothrix sp. FACHB-708]|uniref:oligosaccharide flippase family protein n=1 Tax=unclassified Limnothrix TaxID=2632864 RepID=UPI001682E8DB|nr:MULTISPECIES: polysaccharide biosynthesis C-terminal domain-containing protein [unclassified Limnothrix]MBD2553345.1 polysaccharide biosynthesis C-terminal domain-containing protein [Limnothrix sp. FACHB-708]MBD2590631.1 polysaccharide biosynthesis C-terminal domain-containing protein [Limnothrix sp. FACHB-406]
MPNLQGVLQRLRTTLGKSSVQDNLWMIAARVISVAIQALYFIFVARFLGSKEYGELIGVLSLVAMLSPFIGVGYAHLLMRTVSRDRSSFRTEWGKSLFVWGWSSLLGIGLVMLLASRIWGSQVSPWLVLWMALGDYWGVCLLEFSSSAFLSVGVAARPAQLKVLFSAVKLLAVGALWLVPDWRSAETWSIFYCIASVLPAFVAFVLASRQAGWPLWPKPNCEWELGQGFYFSIAGSAETINANADKTLLSSLVNEEAAGIYGAGYRFVDVGYQPILAIGAANYARFFQAGTNGIDGSIQFAKRLFPLIAGYGVLGGLGMFFFAPVVEWILGSEYREAIGVLRWFAPVHLILGMQYLAADCLTSSGHQGQRSLIQVTAAILNVVLNLILIPSYSWAGAIWATLASETFKMVGLWGAAAFFWRRELAMKTKG